jgi:hypothetical protein
VGLEWAAMQARGEIEMVALSSPSQDYEIVISVFGKARLRCSKFVPW